MAILTFMQLLCVMESTSASEDIVSSLPTEIASKVFRYLDSKSLVAAASVNKRWNRVCKGDKVLKTKVRRRLRAERKARHEAFVNASRATQVASQGPRSMYGQRNGNVEVSTIQSRPQIPMPRVQQYQPHWQSTGHFGNNQGMVNAAQQLWALVQYPSMNQAIQNSNSGGKVRARISRRTTPYNTMRV